MTRTASYRQLRRAEFGEAVFDALQIALIRSIKLNCRNHKCGKSRKKDDIKRQPTGNAAGRQYAVFAPPPQSCLNSA
jgi:hypothetical protein